MVADYWQCDMSHEERDWEWLSHVRKLIDHTSLSPNKEINGCVLCNICMLFWDCFRQVCNSSMKNRWKHESTVSVNGIEVCCQVTQCIQYYISPSINFLFFFIFQVWGRKEREASEGRRKFYKCIQDEGGFKCGIFLNLSDTYIMPLNYFF